MGLYCTLYREADASEELGLERRWGMLSFLLQRAGGDHADFLERDWEELASEAHRIGPADAAALADWLEQTSDANVMSGFDPAAMAAAKVYDSDLVQRHPEDYQSELNNDIAQLRTFLVNARRAGDSVIRVLA